MKMNSFAKKIVLLFFLSGIAPLLILGVSGSFWSFYTSKKSDERLNAEVASNAADQIQRYLTQETNILR
jgi:CHASE3 domain sensor protein